MGGNSGGSTQTIQKSDPWAGIQPYLTQLYSDANKIAGQGYAIPQNSGVADLTPQSQQILQQIMARSQGNQTDQTFANNAAAMSNGSDPISQMLQVGAQGHDWQDNLLGNIVNGTDASTAALTGIAQGKDAASQSLSQVAGGNDAASTYLKGVLSGKYLDPASNPYLSGAVDAASADATRNFQTAVMPQLASQFSLAGRYGSGAQSQGVSDATNNLAQQLSQTAAGIYNTNYQNERGLQQASAGTLGGLQTGAASALGGLQSGAASSLGGLKNTALGTISSNMLGNAGLLSGRSLAGTQLLPTANQLDWNNLNQGLNAASVFQQQAQNQLEGQNALVNANAQMPYNNLQWLASILQGTAGLGGQSSSQQSASGSGVKNAVGGALGGAALGGALAGASSGAIAGPVGMGVGALGGLLLGVL